MALAREEAPKPEESDQMKIAFQRCRHLEIQKGWIGLCINPVVTVVSTVLIWIFVILCIVEPDHMLKAMNIAAFGWIPEVWTWFYIVSQDIWIAVLIFVMVVSRYGNLKLGKDNEAPEYSFVTWFSMLFSAGVAVGLFYYSVAEPVWHFKGWGHPRFATADKGYGNSNEDAIHALMITWYHWGIHGWIPYTTMGAVLAIMSHRRGFPMTIRYIFWPLIGERCYGWIGDAVDILSIMTTIFGVCTSLGLGAMQVNAGLQRLDHGFYRGVNYNIPDEPKYSDPTCGGTGSACEDGKEAYGIQTNVQTQIAIIIIITLVATVSVVSGMDRGIVNLSRFNFSLGMFLLLAVLFLGETYFCLDTVVQTFGYYCWYLFKVAFATDAFERLGGKDMGLGGAPDEKGGKDGWLSVWTIFYWGWWISWGPFVGTFLARISKGRTLRQFILGTLIIPSLYSFVWFGIFGAEGIRMQRIADASGLCKAAYNKNLTSDNCTDPVDGQVSSKCKAYAARYSDEDKQNMSMGWEPECVLDPNYHSGFGRCKEFAWTRPVAVGNNCVMTTTWVKVPCGDNKDPTFLNITDVPAACADMISDEHVRADSASKMFNHFSGTQQSCFVPLQDNAVCLYNQKMTDMFFDHIASYGPRGFSDLLCIVGMVALVLYFVTSSDSGSFVVDMISANGHPNPPIAQRIFWSFTEGATACALLAAGRNLPNSDGSLKALQSASMVAGLPYTFILFWCSQSLVLLCREEAGVVSKDRKTFNSFIFSVARPKSLLMGLFVPGAGMSRVIKVIGGWPFHSCSPAFAGAFWGGVFQCMYLVAIILLICSAELYQWAVIGLIFYIGFATFLGLVRTSTRNFYRIEHGDLVTDWICGCFAPMFTIAQLEDQLQHETTAGKLGAKDEVGQLEAKDEPRVDATDAA